MLSNKVKFIHYIGEHAVIGLNDNQTFLLNSIQKSLVQLILKHSDYEDAILHFIDNLHVSNIDMIQSKNLIQNYLNKLESMGIITLDDNTIDIHDISITGIEGEYYPYRITFELTNACIAHCSHCFKKANDGDLAFIDYSKIYEFNKMINSQFQIVHLTGGEPLLHPDFERIMELFRDKSIELNTNGILIKNYPPDIFRPVKALSIGIYGLSDEEYFLNTGIRNGYTDLCESCEVLAKNGIEFSLSLVINKKNLENLSKYVEVAYSLGASEFTPGLANRIGRLEYVNDENSHWILSPEEKRYAYRKLRELGKEYHGKLLIDDWGRDVYRSDNTIRETERVYKNRCFQCGAGTLKWSITENFMFKPCTMFLDCPQLMLSYTEWAKYVKGEKEIIWSEYLHAFVDICKSRNTIPSEYCDYISNEE